MSRHPHDIVPRDDKDEILVAIFDVLVEIRDALVPTPIVVSGPVPPEMPIGAGAVEAATDSAPVPPASKKTPAKRKPAARKKKPA